MNRVFAAFAAVLSVLGIAAVCCLFFGWIVMLCWNFAAVDVFGAPRIDFWHAVVGVLLLHLALPRGSSK